MTELEAAMERLVLAANNLATAAAAVRADPSSPAASAERHGAGAAYRAAANDYARACGIDAGETPW